MSTWAQTLSNRYGFSIQTKKEGKQWRIWVADPKTGMTICSVDRYAGKLAVALVEELARLTNAREENPVRFTCPSCGACHAG